MHCFYQAREEDFIVKKSINNCYPPHIHKQLELLYVISGSIEVTINGNSKLLNSHDLSICFPNLIHSTNTPNNSLVVLIIFDSSLLSLYSNELNNMYPSEPFVINNYNKDINYSVEKMLSYSARLHDYRNYIGHLYNLVSAIISKLTLNLSSQHTRLDSSRLILEYINNNFTDDICLDSLAGSLNMSKYYISHIFSQKIKMSFTQYLNRCRIDYSRQLLKTTNKSITDIAFECGFNSCRTFFRVFKQLYQITPKEYREQ